MYADNIAPHVATAIISATIIGMNHKDIVIQIGRQTSQLKGLKANLNLYGRFAKVMNHRVKPTDAIKILI
jgi:hypothetical protein